VQDEGINVWPSSATTKGHLVRHQAADEVNVTAASLRQLSRTGDGFIQSRRKLWSALQRVRALAGFHFNEDAAKREAFRRLEAL
jgi:hypothetical protein